VAYADFVTALMALIHRPLADEFDASQVKRPWRLLHDPKGTEN